MKRPPMQITEGKSCSPTTKVREERDDTLEQDYLKHQAKQPLRGEGTTLQTQMRTHCLQTRNPGETTALPQKSESTVKTTSQRK
ncbi:hypothetical protein C922_05439 [Plasmodium inui San Antonio 1]|uniref:Uncharacterized protein n=1 Tax=Plasmodium inui San Antonio 1 TaxID=1237626 RepID=W7AFW1_9APIC|nr:hypothetical protein C922_05439 [Plasmodium inui San Antonio 1]EUD64186.1 hypothetical protein C922_05439 [Plasmodium inui San Antonio 1]